MIFCEQRNNVSERISFYVSKIISTSCTWLLFLHNPEWAFVNFYRGQNVLIFHERNVFHWRAGNELEETNLLDIHRIFCVLRNNYLVREKDPESLLALSTVGEWYFYWWWKVNTVTQKCYKERGREGRKKGKKGGRKGIGNYHYLNGFIKPM